MKSNEEFIAGIYEKAACYTEEKETKIVKVNFVNRATKIAAMVAVCIGLAGIGGMMLNRGLTGDGNAAPETQEHGIALLSEDGLTDTEQGGVQVGPGPAAYRMGPVAEWAEFTGVVESVDTSERIFWLELSFTEDVDGYHPETAYVAVKWDVLESMDMISVGNRVVVSGIITTYENEESERSGAALVVLADITNLRIGE